MEVKRLASEQGGAEEAEMGMDEAPGQNETVALYKRGEYLDWQ